MRKPKPLWYVDHGYRHNPFSIKPAIIHDKLIGQVQTLEEVNMIVKKGGVCLIEGAFGVGKTTFLKSVIRRFAGKRKVLYFSCNRLLGRLNLDKLLHERFGVVGKLLKIKSKNMILLLDEAENLAAADFAAVEKYHKKGYFRSVVFVPYDRKHIRASKRLMRNIPVFPLGSLTKEEAVDLIRSRIGDLSIISDNIIGQIYDITPCSSRMFLKNCEDVCRHVVDHRHKRATKRNIREALTRYIST
jgi:vacuolar-type H+-ATPase catalytic subunit A/Vma1